MTTKEDINKLTALLAEMTKSLDGALVPAGFHEKEKLLAEIEALRMENTRLINLLQKTGENPPPAKITPKKTTKTTTAIVDKFKAQTSINDTIAKPKPSLSVKQPVNDISKVIGINDRFLFSREFFDGDATLFSKTVERLNTASSLEEAKKYIQSVIKNWDETSDTAQLFLSIIQRRYL